MGRMSAMYGMNACFLNKSPTMVCLVEKNNNKKQKQTGQSKRLSKQARARGSKTGQSKRLFSMALSLLNRNDCSTQERTTLAEIHGSQALAIVPKKGPKKDQKKDQKRTKKGHKKDQKRTFQVCTRTFSLLYGIRFCNATNY